MHTISCIHQQPLYFPLFLGSTVSPRCFRTAMSRLPSHSPLSWGYTALTLTVAIITTTSDRSATGPPIATHPLAFRILESRGPNMDDCTRGKQCWASPARPFLFSCCLSPLRRMTY